MNCELGTSYKLAPAGLCGECKENFELGTICKLVPAGELAAVKN